jgi:hypothetical protein
MSDIQQPDQKVFESSIYKRFKMNSHKILIEKPKEAKTMSKHAKGDLVKKYISNTGM